MQCSRIKTPRLTLRPWCQADLAPFAALNTDPRVMEFFPARLSAAESDALAARIVEHFATRGFGLWAVQVIGGPPFIGFVGLSVPRYETPFTPCVEVGWRLAAPHWGRGYASEGARGALAYGFGHLDLAEIVSFTAEANVRSRRVMERLGMRRDPADDFDHPLLAAAHPLSCHVLYRLPRSAWEKRNRAAVAALITVDKVEAPPLQLPGDHA